MYCFPKLSSLTVMEPMRSWLREEGLPYAESFVPLTGIDEENILLTLHARAVSNAKVITKINRIAFKEAINRLDLGSVVYPRYITAEAIIAYVRAKSILGETITKHCITFLTPGRRPSSSV